MSLLESCKQEIVRFSSKSSFISVFNKYTLDHSIVFMLHRFQEPASGTTNVGFITVDMLEKCLIYLLKNGYEIIALKKMMERIRAGENLYKSICLTIDDGYVDIKNVALPIFRKYSVPVTVFITTEFVSGNLMMWWDKIDYLLKHTKKEEIFVEISGDNLRIKLDLPHSKIDQYDILVRKMKVLPLNKILQKVDELSYELGVKLPSCIPPQYSAISWKDIEMMSEYKFDFEAHTVTHPILSRISAEEQKSEISACARELEYKTGKRPSLFCYPNGGLEDFTQDTVSILKDEGFTASFTGVYGFVGKDAGVNKIIDPFCLRRIAFPLEFAYFVQYVSGFEAFKNGFRK